MTRALGVASALVVTAWVGAARAQPADDTADERGQAHLAAGKEASLRGDHDTAAREYTEAYVALHDGRILFYVAREHERLGHDERAALFYRRYLVEVDVPPAHRAAVEATLDRLDPPDVVAPEPTQPSHLPPAPAPDTAPGCDLANARGDAPPLGLEQWCERAGGVKHGPYRAWHPNGAPHTRGTYANGKREGAWTFWYATGARKAQGTYEAGERTGPWTYWHDDGPVSARGSYAHDRRTGEWEYLDETGRVTARGSFRADKKHGAWQVERGDKLAKTTYHQGKPLQCPRVGARPLPHCKATLVGEMGIGLGNEHTAFVWDLGFLVNREGANALGITLGGVGDEDGFHTGVKLRYREYLSDLVSVDVAGGPMLFSRDNSDSRIGIYTQAQLNLEDWVSVGVDFAARDDGTGLRWDTTVNLRAGLPTIGYTLLGVVTVAAKAD